MTTTTTPTPEALRHRAAARRWALALMVLFTVASMAFNVVIAARRGGALEDLVLAGLAPAVLASMGHLLAKFVQAAIEASGVTRHVYWAGVGGVSTIGLGAFILSFENLQILAARQHNWFVSGVFPVTLDLAILVSTGIHVVIGIANEHDQAAGVQPYRGWLARRFGWWNATAPAVPPPAAAAEQAAVSRDTEATPAVARDAEQAAVLSVRIAAQEAVSRAVPAPATVATQRGTEPTEQAVTSDVPHDTGDVPTEPIPVSHRVEVAEQPAVPRDTQPVEAVEQGDLSRDTEASSVVEQKPVSRGTTPVETSEQDDEFVRIAAHLVDAGRTQASVEAAVIVLRGAAQGTPVRELAEAAGISTGAVSRITKAAKELAAELVDQTS
ncbi:hypothetical protein [Mycobacterium sp. D16Q16]|uniref:hypothetical protein n=1 Tax=Mycobacterium sp. D16Q16 TaxID=1855659 RepID=UPI000991A7AD|nr:hypothetical protein [Mycobacterium sp. D16Q16]